MLENGEEKQQMTNLNIYERYTVDGTKQAWSERKELTAQGRLPEERVDFFRRLWTSGSRLGLGGGDPVPEEPHTPAQVGLPQVCGRQENIKAVEE